VEKDSDVKLRTLVWGYQGRSSSILVNFSSCGVTTAALLLGWAIYKSYCGSQNRVPWVCGQSESGSPIAQDHMVGFVSCKPADALVFIIFYLLMFCMYMLLQPINSSIINIIILMCAAPAQLHLDCCSELPTWDEKLKNLHKQKNTTGPAGNKSTGASDGQHDKPRPCAVNQLQPTSTVLNVWFFLLTLHHFAEDKWHLHVMHILWHDNEKTLIVSR